MPVLDRQLTGHQRGPAIMAIFDDLQQVTTIFLTERRQAPVIQNEQVGLGQGRQHFPIASIPFGDSQFWQESRETEVERGQAFATGLVPQRTAEPGFANARRAGEQGAGDAAALSQRPHASGDAALGPSHGLAAAPRATTSAGPRPYGPVAHGAGARRAAQGAQPCGRRCAHPSPPDRVRLCPPGQPPARPGPPGESTAPIGLSSRGPRRGLWAGRYPYRLPHVPQAHAWLPCEHAAVQVGCSATGSRRLSAPGTLPARQVVPAAPWIIHAWALHRRAVQVEGQAVPQGRRQPGRHPGPLSPHAGAGPAVCAPVAPGSSRRRAGEQGWLPRVSHASSRVCGDGWRPMQSGAGG